jgi:NAD+ diphosphatase
LALRGSKAAVFLALFEGKFLARPVGGSYELAKIAATQIDKAETQEEVFLGLSEGVPYFAVALKEAALDHFTEYEPHELRGLLSQISLVESQLAATARSLLEWHRSHRFCSKCGSKSELDDAGWKRSCPDCGAMHFPRTDPVVIMLATKGDMCLLGRGVNFPDPRVFSCLAGFVEPGETLEQAAARELFEETSVTAQKGAKLLFSQPWPWPSSLMVGVHVEIDKTDIELDLSEVAEARWVTRDEVRQILSGEHTEILCPPPFTIAHQMLKHWINSAEA